MSEMIAFCRLALALVLALAAVANRIEPGAASAISPTLPRWLLRVSKLVVAALLIPGTTARWGALGAILLAIGFLYTLTYSMSQRNAADCGCFGRLDLYVPPLISLFRAAVILALADWVLIESWNGPNLDGWRWLETMDPTQHATVLFALLLMVAALAIPGRLVSVLSRLPLERQYWSGSSLRVHQVRPASAGFPTSGLPVGAAAPEWPRVNAMVVSDLPTGIPDERFTIVLFVGPAVNNVRIAERSCERLRVIRVAAFNFPALADYYLVPAVPSAVLISATGIVSSRLAVGPHAIRQLCSDATDTAKVTSVEREREGSSAPAGAVEPGCAPCRG
ncbi:hypothetical protein AYO43_00560 [Nitrospira sp. SCGC AG-212-E16]|nr:hypothetical protein AYO43_00560 [Nitrospira sp. SCGC AG-212-E16]